MRRIGGRKPAIAEQLRERESRRDLRLRCAAGRPDQHQLVSEDIATGFCAQQLPLLQVVHPVQIRGNEHLCRRTGLDLLRERRARAVGDRRLGRRHRGDIVERILQACRGKDERSLLCMTRRQANRSKEKEERASHANASSIDATLPAFSNAYPANLRASRVNAFSLSAATRRLPAAVASVRSRMTSQYRSRSMGTNPSSSWAAAARTPIPASARPAAIVAATARWVYSSVP